MHFDAVRIFSVWLHQVYGLCQQASDDWWTSYECRIEIAAVSADLCLEIVENWVWTSASVPVEKSSFIHNGIQRTFRGIKNFIDIRKRFCFIKNNFCSALIEKSAIKTVLDINKILYSCESTFDAIMNKTRLLLHGHHGYACRSADAKPNSWRFSSINRTNLL